MPHGRHRATTFGGRRAQAVGEERILFEDSFLCSPALCAHCVYGRLLWRAIQRNRPCLSLAIFQTPRLHQARRLTRVPFRSAFVCRCVWRPSSNRSLVAKTTGSPRSVGG